MTTLTIHQIDAFADRPFTGNPAAVMPLDAWLADDVLQAIARENNLSETAFILPDASGEADYELRWFTPTSEVVLCGHATLASGHFVLEQNAELDRVTFRTRRAGPLAVERDSAGGSDYFVTLPAYVPEPRPAPNILFALGIEEAVECLWHPNRYALIVVERPDQVISLQPDFRKLAAEGDVLTIVTAPAQHTDILSRVFAPGAGIDEDPVTGSAHAVMVPYWTKRLGRDEFSAFQASARGGWLNCRLEGDRVVLGGRCVTVMEGVFRL